MKKKILNDISSFVTWNKEKQILEVTSLSEKEWQTIYEKYLFENASKNILNLPSVYDLLNKVFHFYNELKTNVVEGAIRKSHCIKEMIFLSLGQQKGPKISLVQNDCLNKDHINAAKRFISEINNFCYKNNIDTILFDRTFLFVENNIKFWGHIDLLLANQKEIFQIEIKTSRTNYVEKYEAQLLLNKCLVENSREIKIKESLILNVFVPQIYLSLNNINLKLQKQLLNSTNSFYQ